MHDLICKNISLFGSDSQSKRAEILQYFQKTYDIYEKLFEILENESVFYEQPERLRHPLIFYYGHTASFYINKLVLTGKASRVNERFESIFAIGVDEMSWDDLDSQNYTWPSLSETKIYRQKAKEIVENFILTEPLALPITWDSPFWIILMGIEHERIHLETSSVLIRQLDIKYTKTNTFFKICDETGSHPINELLPVLSKNIKLGKNHNDDFYGWDNEYGCFEAEVKSFNASKYLVSNGEFLEFVNDNGYTKDEFWEEEGLCWRNYTKQIHPPFWSKNETGYDYRTINSIIKLPLNWPVDVNYHEAKAYCNWLGKKMDKKLRLPTESEWHALYNEAYSDGLKANINLEHYASSCPVNMFSHGNFYDVIGNVWQWCETPIYSFEGFKIHPAYDDFSVPTFDDRHNIIKGGSFISTGNEAMPWSRYAFRKHFFQHAGFRYVESENEIEQTNSSYETDMEIANSLEANYGSEYLGVQNFYQKIAEIAIGVSDSTDQKKALDINCSTGRSSFELAKVFDEVIGIDFSARFIRCGEHLVRDGKFRYMLDNDKKDASLDEICIDAESRGRVKFWQGDACNLKPIFTGFDLILSANTIEKLYDPIKFLTSAISRLSTDGVFVLSSTYEFKNKSVSTQNIRDFLEQNMDEIYEPIELKMVKKISERRFEYLICEVSVWQKKQ